MARRGYGEGSVYQRTRDNRWIAAISVGGRKRREFSARTKSEAKQILAEKQRVLAEGRLVGGATPIVERFLREWLEDMKPPRLRPKSHVVYTASVNHVCTEIGWLKLSALRPAHIQRCYTHLLERYAPKTVEIDHRVFHQALDRAVAWGYIPRNWADDVETPRIERGEARTLSLEEWDRLWEVTEGHRLQPLWLLLVTTGLRLGEATGLRWSDIDLERRTLRVQLQLQRVPGEGLQLVDVKTATSRRAMRLSKSVVAGLCSHLQRQRIERLAAETWQDHGLVFCRPDGRPLAPSSCLHTFQRSLEEAGVSRMRIHDLRHTCATFMLAQHVHPKVVQARFGHSSSQITMNLYSHMMPDMDEEAADLIDDLITRKRGQEDAG